MKYTLHTLSLCLCSLLCAAFTPKQPIRRNDTPLFTFGVIADVQYADVAPHKERYYRHSLEKLSEAVKRFNRERVDFTLNLGDAVDCNPNDLDRVLQCLQLLKAPVYHLTGNHDYHGVTQVDALYRKLDIPAPHYYTVEKDGWMFVFLNTNEIASYAPLTDEQQAELLTMRRYIEENRLPQGATWNGGVSRTQLAWLDSLLQETDRTDRKVIICSHHPLYPENYDTALNNREVLQVIGSHSCVKLLLAGHHHAGDFATYQGIPAVTLEGMVETASQNAFAIIRVYADRIELEGIGRVKSRKM
jgi:manganese-dependent ADP-ribose/CDP-alcohol diphosphatase